MRLFPAKPVNDNKYFWEFSSKITLWECCSDALFKYYPEES